MTDRVRNSMLKEHGFTIIEFVITLSIITLLLLLAHPLYQYYQQSIHEAIVHYELEQDLRLAKNLASIEERYITLCGSNNGFECINPQAQQWRGWILFYDDKVTFTPIQSQIIHVVMPDLLQKAGVILETTVNIGGGINFGPRREYAYGMGRSIPNGRIKLCRITPQKGLEHIAFIVNVYGYFRLSQEKSAC